MSSKFSGTATVLAIIGVTALTRVFHVIPNLAPMTALAVFGAWTFRDSRLSYLVPLLAMVIGDIGLAIVNSDMAYAFHDTQIIVYACLAATAWMTLKFATQDTMGRRIGSILSGSVLFFVATNFAVWMFSGMYPQTVAGLAECYTLAIPFFRTSLLSDIVYGALMFGAYELAMRSGLSAVPAKR